MLAAGTAFAGPAEDLLAKAKEASGGAAWDTAIGFHLKGEGSVAGYSVDIDESVDLQSGAWVRLFSAMLGSGGEGYDGTSVGWGRNPWDGLVTNADPAKNGGNRMRAFFNRRGYFKGEGKVLKDLGEVNWDGQALVGVEVAPAEEGMPATELWFDKGTMLLARTIRRGERTIEGRLSDYRDVGGVKLPCKRETFVNGEAGDYSQCETIEALAAPDPARFAAPAE